MGLAERWLRGFDVAPGERRALRSVFVFIKRGDGQEQWLGGWTPWYAMTSAPSSAAYRLPAHALLTVELHYKTWTESGQALSDTSTLGLYFQSRRPKVALRDLTVTASPVKPDDGRLRLRGELTLDHDVMAWALRPRLANRGDIVAGSIEVKAVRPDGGIEPLVWVKENRPDWQLPFVLRDPVRLPRGSRLVVTAYAAEQEGSPIAVVSIASYPASPPEVRTASVALAAKPTPARPRR